MMYLNILRIWVEFGSPDFKIGIMLAVLKHSGKIARIFPTAIDEKLFW